MKHALIAVAVASLIGGSAFAQMASKANVEKQIIEMERAVNTAFAKNDAAGFRKMLAADALGADPMGVMTIDEYVKMLPQVKIESWNIDQSRFQWVSDEVVIHIYRWSGKGSMMDQPLPSPMLASTVWAKRGGRWVATFHHESPLMPAPPAK